jgi:hypothetical protein
MSGKDRKEIMMLWFKFSWRREGYRIGAAIIAIHSMVLLHSENLLWCALLRLDPLYTNRFETLAS